MYLHFSTILVFLTVGAGFILAALLAGALLRPRRKSRAKSSTYECGEPPWGSAWFNFNPRFYLVALIFIIFDVEIAFMFPVAAVFRRWMDRGDGIVAFVEIAVFLVILFVGIVYAWANGDFDWVKSIRGQGKGGGGS